MSKKTRSKELRRQKEIERAQIKSQKLGVSMQGNVEKIVSSVPSTGSKLKEEKYQLPIQLIKRDLVKTSLYAVFVILALVLLNVSKVDFFSVQKLLVK
jgi:hypothetical protein